MPFHQTGEASRMYSKYDEAQFHLRLPHELHAKIKQRAKMNNRSLNSEIIAAIEESLTKQSSASVYIDDAERMAEQQSDIVKKIVFDTSKRYIKKTAVNHQLRRIYAKRYAEYCVLHIWFLHVPGVCEAILTTHQTWHPE